MNKRVEYSSYSITVVCSDGSMNSSAEAGAFTLELESLSVANVHILLSSNAVKENSPAGTEVGE